MSINFPVRASRDLSLKHGWLVGFRGESNNSRFGSNQGVFPATLSIKNATRGRSAPRPLSDNDYGRQSIYRAVKQYHYPMPPVAYMPYAVLAFRHSRPCVVPQFRVRVP
jgi:hypothetical protein